MTDTEAERARLMEEVARRNRKMFEDLKKGNAGGAEKAEKKSKAPRKSRAPQTSPTFFKKLQKDAQIVPVVRDNKTLEGLIASRAADFDKTFNEFDRIYKPYVYYLLEKYYYFKRGDEDDFSSNDTDDSKRGNEGDFGRRDEDIRRADEDFAIDGSLIFKKVRTGPRPSLRNNGVDAEEIYDDVVVALLGGALWRFDFDSERVGQGAFRRYLREMVQTVFYNAVRPDLIPAFDEDGKPIYTNEFVKDRKGQIKKDENGNPIRRQKMISRFVFEKDQAAMARVKGLRHLFDTRKESTLLFTLLSRLAQVAYLRAIEDKRDKGRATWQVDALRAVFENQESSASVIDRLMKDGTITGREAFDTAKSYFLSRWRERWDKLCSPIISKATVKRDDAFVRRLKVTEDEAILHVDKLEKENERKSGSHRVEAVRRNFTRAMLLLVQKADERAAQKNARYYEETK